MKQFSAFPSPGTKAVAAECWRKSWPPGLVGALLSPSLGGLMAVIARYVSWIWGCWVGGLKVSGIAGEVCIGLVVGLLTCLLVCRCANPKNLKSTTSGMTPSPFTRPHQATTKENCLLRLATLRLN